MRLELAGSLVQPDPLIIRFNVNQNFDPATYMDLGFTHFEVICIGSGGGIGGGINTNNTGTQIRNYGGAGGGGGFHRVRGLLSALPASCPVVVGIAGIPGNDHASDPAQTTNGADGGYSSFNGGTCQASGGKGGRRAQSNSTTVRTQADGGDGGIGNRTIAGGGGIGGTAGTPSATGPGIYGANGLDGTLANNVGKGGGGGAGGVDSYADPLRNPGTSGGRGSYNPGDTSVYGPGGTPNRAYPGSASGAKAAPLNGLPTVYGQSGQNGVVILRLTAE